MINPLPMPLDAPVTITFFPSKYSSVVTSLVSRLFRQQ